MRKVILMYHDVYKSNFNESGFIEGNAWQYKVNVDGFEAQVKAIAEYCAKEELAEEFVEFTFDDGGVSFLTEIATILEKYDFKGVFYISTKYIDTSGFLTNVQIKELYERGHIIGSHSHTHPNNLGKMSNDDIILEWAESKKILENIIQDKVVMASIPNGNGSNNVYEGAFKVGFKVIDTSIPSTKERSFHDMIIRGRYVIHNNTSTEDVIELITNSKRRKIMYIKWKLLSIVKHIFGPQYDRIKKVWLNMKVN